MRPASIALRTREIRSPWNTFFGDMSQKNIDIQCSAITMKTQCLYTDAYTVSEATRDITVPNRHRNWKITPNHVNTKRWTFWMRTFLLKLASAQHTLNSDNAHETMFKSLKVRNWCCCANVGCCTMTGVTWPPPNDCNGISGLKSVVSSCWIVTKMYNWSNNIGAASQNACTSRSIHKSRTSCFTWRKSTGTNNLAYRHSTPNWLQWSAMTQYWLIFNLALALSLALFDTSTVLLVPLMGFFLSMLSVSEFDNRYALFCIRILCKYHRNETICKRIKGIC